MGQWAISLGGCSIGGYMHLRCVVLVFLVVFMPSCAHASAGDEPALPAAPVVVAEAGILFDGGSMSVTLDDADGRAWRLHFPHTSQPLPTVTRHLKVAVLVDDEVAEPVTLGIGSDAEARVYNQLAAWLSSAWTADEIKAIHDESIWESMPDAGRSLFDAVQDDEAEFKPDPKRARVYIASCVIDLLAAITVERAIASNTALREQRDEIAEEVLNAPHGGHLAELAFVRWDQFHKTLRAALCGPSWTPGQQLKLPNGAGGQQ